MKKQDLILEIEDRGINVPKIIHKKLDQLQKILKKEVGQKNVRIKLRSTIVGAVIATLFFNYRDQVLEGRSFTIKISKQDSSRKKEKIDQLNSNTKDTVLELINVFNSASHINNTWFFREVLAKVVNENLDKLKAVCAAICKEPMEELLKDEEVHENVTHVLQFFGVEVLTNQIVKSEIPSSCASIADQFMEDINVYSEKEAKEDCSSDELAFSGLTRKIILDLEEKGGLTDKEKKDSILKVVSKIKEGINILADNTAANIDIQDMFLSFELINSKIENEQKKEIVEFACQKGNVKLLEMICEKEKKDKVSFCLNKQYSWKGNFSGYSRLIELLQYVIDNRCSPEIVLCLAEKTYGYAHILYNGEQYFSKRKIEDLKRRFNYQDSDIKDLLKQAVKLGYKDAVSVMLSGDIYHCIRSMKLETFQEKEEFVQAYDTIKKTIADVISSWKEDCKDDVQLLLDQGIEIDIDRMKKQDLILQIIEDVPNIAHKTLDQLKKILKKEVGQKNVRIKLRLTIVGALIVTLFFNYRDQVLEGRSFTIKISKQDSSRKKEKIDQLNSNVKDTVFELINVLNSASHINNNWFFREVLVKVVNENLDKLKAVCAAICKEPMEELLRGEEVHEDVIDVLQFFGVEKDFLLLRKNTTNVAGSVSVKSIDKSLSDTSEKSVSSSSQQSLADDRPKNASALQTRGSKSLPHPSTESRETQEQSGIRKSVPTLKSQKSHLASSSKLTEKNNEGAMQKNYGQNKGDSYTDIDNFCYQDETVSRRLVMPRVDLQSARDRRKERENVTLQKVSKQTFLDPPKFKDLFKANRMMYMKKTLDDFVLSYDPLSYHSAYGISSLQWNLNESGNSSRSSEGDEQEFNELFINNDYFHKYEDAINKLIKDDTSAAQILLLELAEQAVEPACYARALSLFKELMKKCDVQNNKEENDEVMEKGKDDIKEAVELLEFCMDTMNPASSFLLGIMKAFNIGNCSQFIKGPWQKDLANVINVGQGFGGDCNLEESILQAIKRGSWDVQGSVGLGMKNKTEDVKKMFKYSLYEFVHEMISEKNINRSAVNDAFAVLSKDDFPEGLYAHGSMIIQGKIGGNSQDKVAIKLLNRANELGHKGAKFMLGTLPLQKGVYCKSQKEIMSYIRMLESYLNESDDSCYLNKSNVDKAALCLVAEYSSKRSVFLEYDAAKVKEILDMRNLHQKWADIQHESMMSFGNDSFLRAQPMQSSTPQCSAVNSPELPSFSGELSDISEVPDTKLSEPLAKNQGASQNLRQ
ncbi:hypothetical protein [Wolbachia endosymbiont (group B) of Horisme vitalbata]|uniref:hypothetical protein n=1 Tax=Wolbachia endosymbiont (group B) of Horisme vitalbata TaxID=3066178 RepID=UPI00334246A9